jgi:hypothetical protein
MLPLDSPPPGSVGFKPYATRAAANYFLDIENRINPTPSIIRVMGQGRGSPRGFGLPRIMRIESIIKRTPEMIKHAFAIFNKVDLQVNLVS